MRKVTFLIISVILFLAFVSSVDARSGCCSWHGGVCGCDTSVGRQVCCDSSYSPSCGCTYIPPIPTFPPMNATWSAKPNIDRTFNLFVTLDDSSPTRYSAVISQCMGCDPGPLVDFYSSKFSFNNLETGRYYLNVKKAINGYWSTIAYWVIDIPIWSEPTPTLMPTIASIAATNQTQSSSTSDFITTLIVIAILLSFCIGVISVLFLTVRWFLKFAKEHDWIYSVLFWGAIILFWIISSISNIKSSENNNYKAKYTCNCSKTCSYMTCEEAYFQLNDCGCTVRDGDHDGIPCENVCR